MLKSTNLPIIKFNSRPSFVTANHKIYGSRVTNTALISDCCLDMKETIIRNKKKLGILEQRFTILTLEIEKSEL